MGLIDRVAARWGFVRSAPRRGGHWARNGFAAGGNGNLTAGWTSSDTHINQALYRSLRTLRARSRDLSRNNDYARQFLRMVRTNVAGPTGFNLQVHARYGDGRLDTRDSDRCETAFWQWGKRENADYAGRLSWVELQQLYIETVARDGEVLVRRIRGANAGAFGYQLQLLDPALLDETYNAELPGGRRIRMSIELDADNRPVAYHLVKADVADPTRQFLYAKNYQRVPAEEIWHDFLPESIGQLRGVPWMATTLIRQKRLGSYEDAAVAAAEEGAKKMAWIKTATGDMTALADRVSADGQPDNPAPTAGTLYTESGEGVHYAALPSDAELQNWDPKYPEQNFGDFVKAQLRGIASGLGVAYHVLGNDLEGVNFSSARAGILEEREVWKSLQGWMIDRLCARVYTEWLPFAIVSGQLAVPMDKLAKFDAAVWQGRRWSWVDPKKDVDASVTAIENGLTSRARVIRDMGGDPEEVWAELAREKEQLKDLLPTKQPAPTPPAKDEDEDETDAEDTDKKALRDVARTLAAKPAPATNIHIAEGALQLKTGDTHVTVPEREVKLEAHMPEVKNAINVAAPQVHVKAYPSESTEHIERDAHHEMTTVRRINKD